MERRSLSDFEVGKRFLEAAAGGGDGAEGAHPRLVGDPSELELSALLGVEAAVMAEAGDGGCLPTEGLLELVGSRHASGGGAGGDGKGGG